MGGGRHGPLPVAPHSCGIGGYVLLQKDHVCHQERRPPHYVALRLSPSPAHETQIRVWGRRDATRSGSELTADAAVCDRPRGGPRHSEEPRGRAVPTMSSRPPRV